MRTVSPYEDGLSTRHRNAAKLRAEGGSLADYDRISQQEWLRGQLPPTNGRIKLFRAIRPGTTLQPGDYVTNSCAYAEQHLQNNLGGEGAIQEIDGFLDEIFPADGPGEFWYLPRWLDSATLSPTPRD